jgi:hypothetical protein
MNCPETDDLIRRYVAGHAATCTDPLLLVAAALIEPALDAS